MLAQAYERVTGHIEFLSTKTLISVLSSVLLSEQVLRIPSIANGNGITLCGVRQRNLDSDRGNIEGHIGEREVIDSEIY